MPSNLRIAFLVDHTLEVPAWYAATINAVTAAGYIVFFIAVRAPRQKDKDQPFVYRLFTRFEAWWFRSGRDAARPVKPQALSDSAPHLFVQDPFRLTAEEKSRINALQLHLIYTIDFHGDVGENCSEAALYGLWYARLGQPGYDMSCPTGLGEVMNNSPVTGSSLLMRNEGRDILLYEGTTPSVPFSVFNNFNAVAWKTASFLPHRLHSLAVLGEALPGSCPHTEAKPAAPVRYPGNATMLLFWLRNVLRYLRYKLASFRSNDRFTLLYASQDFDPATLDKTSFRPLPLPDGVFYADPFLYRKGNTTFLFFEEYRDTDGKAHISVMERDANGGFLPSRAVLKKDYHLSYPFVFAWQGADYMIPETSANGTVELYRAKSFPGEWEHVQNLLEGVSLIDATLHEADGRWWLFAAGAGHPYASTNDQLFIFFSDDLLGGKWTPHPLNPVATHAGNCRPAGRIFRHNGKLYRPAQDNASPQYGFGLVLNEILVLNEVAYREREVARIHPEALGLKAVHGVAVAEGIIVIDGILKS